MLVLVKSDKTQGHISLHPRVLKEEALEIVVVLLSSFEIQ